MMAYPHKWSPMSYKSSAGQRKHFLQIPMLYRWTTQPTNAITTRPSQHWGALSLSLGQYWLSGWLFTKMPYRRTVTYLSSNQAQCRIISLMWQMPLPLGQVSTRLLRGPQ